MALISPNISVFDENNLHIIQWGPAKFGDTFKPISRGDIVDRSIQCDGTFGVGTVVNIQGSNNAISTTSGNYYNLTDPFSNVIAMTAPGIHQITEVTSWMRPFIASGDTTEQITVTVCARRSFK